MPIRITSIDRIIGRICIPVGADAGLGGVEGVGRQEPAENGIVVPCVQVLQAGFGVDFLADVAFTL